MVNEIINTSQENNNKAEYCNSVKKGKVFYDGSETKQGKKKTNSKLINK